MEASVVELRKKMRDVMSAIERHEHVTLTHRGHRCAVIVPLSKAKSGEIKASELPAFGIWADREEMADPVSCVEKLRATRYF